MKTSTKRIPLYAVVMFVVTLLVSAALAVGIGARSSRAAAEQTNEGLTYYYDQLRNSALAQKFYNIFVEMDANGDFADGKKDYDLTPVLSQNDLADYARGTSSKIPVALGAARDAFYLDHPELFYVDVHKLVFTIAMHNDEYVAYLGAGRADNYYAANTVSNATEVAAAVEKFDTAVDAIVTAARAASTDVVEQIGFVNKKVAEAIEYSYGAYEDQQKGVVYNGYVGTAYSLVEKEALCGGYSTAFKAVMDRLDIPCVLIGGSALSGKTITVGNETLEAGYESHMWNAVKLDGLWYAVDVTWNDTTNNLNKYLLVGDDFLARTHVADPVISSSGFEVKYPVLRPFNYGTNSDNSGFTFIDSGKINETEFGYAEHAGGNYALQLGVSFDNKNIIELRNDGKYYAKRAKDANGWSSWTCMPVFWDNYLEMSGYTDEEVEGFWNSMVAESYTIEGAGHTVEQLQFAVVDRVPAEGVEYTAAEMDEHAIAVSVMYSNDAYMRFIPAPYVKKLTPDEKGSIKSFDPIDITIEYSENLVKVEGKEKEPVAVTVVGEHADTQKYIKVENVVWDEGTNKISFKFTPSSQYSHSLETYSFAPANLVGKDSGKTPESARLTFRRNYVVCPKVYNDGRLYMKVFGEPKFVSASDESLSDFKDKNGKPIVGDQRSQLMLVVNKPTQTESDKMEQAAKDEFGLNGEGDIMASSTYQIDLQLCGFVQKVPTGSFMQVGFGFPEGFGPDDAGVTFTVYHYTRKANGEIDKVEAVPCVVTECGIMATVKSFSPFMICAVKSDKVASTAKNVVAMVDGIGGKVDKTDIATLESGSITYTITKDKGYAIDRVTVNNVDRTADVTADGKLTLDYASLESNNVVNVTFIADSVKAADTQKGITRLAQPTIVVTDDDMIIAYAPDSGLDPVSPDPGKKSNAGLIVGIVLGVVALLAAGGVAAFFLLRKKKQAQAAPTATKAKTSQSKTATRSKTNSSSTRNDRNKK